MRYLVDTDWIIDHLRGKVVVKEKLKEYRPSGIAVSIVSLAELYEMYKVRV
jgi:tRNA(fMet)-specific endonuclease VapC